METPKKLGSRFFKDIEFLCRCGKCGLGIELMDQSFLNRLDLLRTAYGLPMILTSSYRCRAYNDKIKGSKNSQHCLGRAVDVAISEPDKRWKFISCAMYLGFGGVGLDGCFAHVDSRPETKVFWLYPEK